MADSYSVTESVIAFIDLLGYKELIQSCNNDKEMLNQELKNLLNNIIPSSWFLKKLPNDKQHRLVKTLSDCFVICWKLKNENSDKEIGNSIEDILQFQCTLAIKGIFLRGGIDISNNYFDDNIIFGSGIITAYKLESESAIYPRILLSENTLQKVITSIKSSSSADTKNNYLANWIIKDSDGLYFIDYLHYVQMNGDRTDHLNEAIKMLNDHKREILKKLDDEQNSPKVHTKFEWLVKYHNFFCRRHYPEQIDLIIDSEIANFEYLYDNC